MNAIFGMIGLGMQEILILGLCCCMPIVAITITFVVVFMMRRKKNSDLKNPDTPETETRNS